MSERRTDGSIDEQLSALVDGELRRDEQTFLLKRLAHDADARARLERYYLIRDALQRSLPEAPVRGLADGVRARIEAEQAPGAEVEGTPAPARQSGRPLKEWKRSAAGLALAATVAVVTVTWWSDGALMGTGGSGEPAATTAEHNGGSAVADAPTRDGGNGISAGPMEVPTLESFERFMPDGFDRPAPAALGEFGATPADDRPTQGGSMEAPAAEWEAVDPAELGIQIRELLVDHAEHVGAGGLGGILDYVRVAGHGEEE